MCDGFDVLASVGDSRADSTVPTSSLALVSVSPSESTSTSGSTSASGLSMSGCFVMDISPLRANMKESIFSSMLNTLPVMLSKLDFSSP